jgi:hypothetical protein
MQVFPNTKLDQPAMRPPIDMGVIDLASGALGALARIR